MIKNPQHRIAVTKQQLHHAEFPVRSGQQKNSRRGGG